MAMVFATPLVVTGPARTPRQMLQDQSFDGHSSVHDQATADRLGLAGAPIEAPTHFSQIDPLAVAVWGQRWFEEGCVSAHFRTMVVEGEEVTATLETVSPTLGRISAAKADGTPVLVGTAGVGSDAAEASELSQRLAAAKAPGELFIVDRLQVGQAAGVTQRTAVDLDTPNGTLYPFSLREKLAAITEPSPWYDSADNPWRRPILPVEMVSVLTQKTGVDLPVRGPALGLFLDLEVRMLSGPLFVGQEYLLDREVIGLGQSRRTESYWTRTTVTDAASGAPVAAVTLHSGVFKESFPDYPADRL